MRKTFRNGDYALSVYTIDRGKHVWVTSRHENNSAAAALPKKDVPAFALAVLEAAGYVEGVGKDWGSPFQLEAIRSLKDHIRQQEEAAEASALDKEAETLARAYHDCNIGWLDSDSLFKNRWRQAARKARELHKAEVKA